MLPHAARRATRRVLPICLLLAAVLDAAGCATLFSNRDRGQVNLLPNRQVIALDTDDIVLIMRRSGLRDDEIIESGTEIRNALAPGPSGTERGRT